MIRLLCLVLAGAGHALAFAPDPLPAGLLAIWQVLMLAVLCHAVWRSGSVARAAWAGIGFGLGSFAVGLYWIFISLHVYGQMAVPLAGFAVVALSAGLALLYALATGLAVWLVPPARFQRAGRWWFVAVFATTWTGAEWLRGTVFTGFPWLNIGYGHVDGWLAGWGPVFGVYGVAWWAALSAGIVAAGLQTWRSRPEQRLAWGLALVLPWLVGLGLVQNPWGVQAHGEPLPLRLVQGNVSQSNKFDPDLILGAMDRHVWLAGADSTTPGFRPEVVILPETAIPLFQDQVPVPLWQPWLQVAGYWGGTVVTGIALHLSAPDGESRFTNSVIGFDSDVSPFALINGRVPWRYDKSHLVPFGEFVPPGFRWFVNAMIMPMGDFDRGARRQPPFALGEQWVAFNICYEDIFGEELLPALYPGADGSPGATLLANVSNLGWFGDSWALRQHLQMARMRSIETARPSVRATNTGYTAVIDRHGRVVEQLAPHSAGVLDAHVQGTVGYTPYVRWGNAAVLLWLGLILVLALRRRWRHWQR